MFSHYFTYLFKKLHFFKVVIARFIKILFRKERDIELLFLDYNTEHIFDNSFIEINYRFRNAIYYRFNNHTTLEKHAVVFGSKAFEDYFELVVYGFFQKKRYQIEAKPQLTLHSDSFKTAFSNLNLKLEEQQIPKLTHSSIFLKLKRPFVKDTKINIVNNKIEITNNPYNQNEFI